MPTNRNRIINNAIVALIGLIIFYISPVSAEELSAKIKAKTGENKYSHFDATAKIGKLSGHTTYQIGGNTEMANGESLDLHFPISELLFPLDVYMASFDIAVNHYNKFSITAGIQASLTKNAGKMEDSDWGWPIEYPTGSGVYYSNPNSLDIYSESSSDLNSMTVDLNFRYHFMETNQSVFNMIYSAGIGYIYQQFNYKCTLIRQWSPSGLEGFDVVGNGTTAIKYEAIYKIPYLEFILNGLTVSDIEFESAIGFAPYVKASDIDNHLMRQPVLNSEGQCTGSAFLFSLNIFYHLESGSAIGLGFEYMLINTEGTEKQYVVDVYSATIDKKMFSEQIYFPLSLTLKL